MMNYYKFDMDKRQGAEYGDKPRYYAGLCRLVRFSDYTIEKPRKDQALWIKPAENTRVEFYQPFDFEPGMLRDYLDVRNTLRTARSAEEQLILDHMGNFLTGMLSSSEREKQMTIERIKNSDKSRTRKERKDAERRIAFWEQLPVLTPELTSRFQSRLDRDKPLILDFCRRYGDAFAGTASEGILRAYYDDEMKPPLPKSERVDFGEWIRENYESHGGLVSNWYEPCHILQMYDAWEKIRASSIESGPVDQFIDLLNGFTVSAGLTLVFHSGHWRIDFEAGYLMDALAIMLINNITSGIDQIRLCALEDCRRPFVARDPRSNYCCQTHSQRGRVRKHRKKQNGKKRGN
jgi:hypothetical protein